MKNKPLPLLIHFGARLLPLLLLMLLCFRPGGDAWAQTPQYSFTGGTSSNVFPLNSSSSNKVQWVYEATHFPGVTAGAITDIYIMPSGSSSNATYSNLTIKLGHTALTTMTSGPWITPLTTVFSATSHTFTGVVSGTWLHIPLQTPFSYNGTSGLILEISQTSYSGGFALRQNSAGGNTRLYGNVTSGTGTQSSGRLNFGFDVLATPCSGTPSTPLITTPALSSPICANTTKALAASDPNQPILGMTYQWEQAPASTGPWTNVVGGTGGTTLNYTTPAMTANTWYRIKATCTNSSQTATSAAYHVTVTNPQITSTTPAARCSTGTVTLSAAGNGSGIKWYTAATGGSSVSSSASYTTPSISATTTYYAVATSGSCESTPRSAVAATVNPLPSVSLTQNGAATFCPGNSMTLSVPTGSNLTYQWKQGGTNISGATSASHTISTAGSYTVQVSNTVTGCTNTSAAVSAAIGTPASGITPTGTVTVCPGSSTTLNTNNAIGLSYQWYRNGVAIAGANNVSLNTNQTGNYTVQVSSAPNCASTTASPTLVGNHPQPPAAFTAPANYICQGSSMTLAAVTGSGLSYQWMQNGSAIGGATGTSYNATNAGSYQLKVTQSSTGCSDTSNPMNITVASLPTATATAVNQPAGCDSVLATANGGSGLSYQWMLNGQTIPGATSQQLAAVNTGAYTVQVTDTNSCVKVSAALPLTVHQTPPATVTYHSPLEFCEGGGVALNAVQQTGWAYQWKRNGNNIAGATTHSTIASLSGGYSVQITNNFGCSKESLPLQVSVDPLPTPAVNQNGLLLTTGNYATYQWQFNNQPIPNAINQAYQVTQNGAYNVVVTDANGCTASSPMVFINQVSVHEALMLPSDVVIYPNPVHDRLYITAPKAVKASLRDLQGKTLMTLDDAREIDMSQLADGVYILLITDLEGRLITTEKVLKRAW